jgi:hypothetical protein
MRERVSTIQGRQPVILVCPHGADDSNTAVIAELAAKQLNCYAVINRGFERADEVDVDNDKANCNRIDHAKAEVVFEEFLKPVQRFQQKISAGKGARFTPSNLGVYGNWYANEPCHVFHIHGCGNHVHAETGDTVDVIVGYGLGTKVNSLSCDEWRKSLFVSLWEACATGEVYVGRGGKYAGRDANNMNQYYRKHMPNPSVQSMQLEFPFSMRSTEAQAATTAMMLALVLDSYIKVDDYAGDNGNKFI